MRDPIESYHKTREATERLRVQIDNLEETGIDGLNIEDVKILLEEREEHYATVDRAVQFMSSGGADSLGSAMAADFARLRGEG